MRILAVAVLLALAILVRPVQAEDRFDDCFRKITSNTEDKIAVCTGLIDSGRWHGNDLAMLLSNRGLGYIKDNDLDGALADFNRALDLNPDQTYALDQRGEVWRMRGNYDKAIADYRAALALDAEFLGAYYDLGNLYKDMGDMAKARANFRLAVEHDGKGRALDVWAKREARKKLDELDNK